MNKETTQKKPRKDNESTFWFIVFDMFTFLFEIFIYFLSFVGPIYFLWLQRDTHIFLLAFWGILSWFTVGIIFPLLLVIIKRLFIGHIPYGKYLFTNIKNKNGLKWIFSDRILKILNRSPFAKLVASNVLYRTLFYKGMGAKINSTLIMGDGTTILEPWSFSAGRNVILGENVSITGHKVEKNTLTLGPVTMGNNVTIGSRTIVFPDVKIGNNVVIGAGSIVAPGTNIPDGEKWLGIPAKKINMFGD